MPDGYLILDRDGCVADSNSVARELLAVACPTVGDPDDVIGTDVEEFVAEIEFVDGGEAPLDEGHFAVDWEDETRHVSLQSTVLEDDGFFIGRLVTFRDITKKVQAERQLRRERREFETLFTHMTDPVAKVEYDGGGSAVEAVNPAFAETFGYEERELVGESLREYIVPEDRLAAAADVNQQIQAGRSVRREVKRRTPDGERDFLLRSAPVDRGATRTVYLIYTDITDEKRHQRQLERQNRRLDQFASIVSHDLRNPLNVARGLLETADQMDDPQANVAEAINSLDRMEAMIGDVLTLARQGDDVAEPDPVTLDAAAEMAWANVDTGSASFEVDGSTTFRADPDRLLQLFENLFRNSIEHVGEDVTVSVGPVADGHGFYVADDGPGIPESQRDEVFDHGYTTNPKGTGFGLSIVDQIATAHGWDARVTEADAGGARFEILGVDSENDDLPAGSAETEPDSATSS